MGLDEQPRHTDDGPWRYAEEADQSIANNPVHIQRLEQICVREAESYPGQLADAAEDGARVLGKWMEEKVVDCVSNQIQNGRGDQNTDGQRR